MATEKPPRPVKACVTCSNEKEKKKWPGKKEVSDLAERRMAISDFEPGYNIYLCQGAFGQGASTSIGIERNGLLLLLVLLDRSQRHVTVHLVGEHAFRSCFEFVVVVVVAAVLDLVAVVPVNRQQRPRTLRIS